MSRSLLRLTPIVILLVLVTWPGVALAFNEGGTVDPTVTDCAVCHDDDYVSGLHGGYITTTRRCPACHTVHDTVVGSVILLNASTVKASCEACHDGTGGHGVYGVLAARGVSVVSRHRIDTTNTVPGGDPSTGNTTTPTFTGSQGRLSCNDCHSPHAASTVPTFTGDRMRTATDTADFVSNRLLKVKPTTATTAVAVYGSDWCGSCHKGRLGTSAVHNHPTDSADSTTSPFYYEDVARLVTSTTTTMGPMGQSNRGYLMPDPRSTEQAGHAPICQQCHEDARSVGSTVSPTAFSVTAVDGTNATDNPRFQVFPHEGENIAFQIETDDDLCLNCHSSG